MDALVAGQRYAQDIIGSWDPLNSEVLRDVHVDFDGNGNETRRWTSSVVNPPERTIQPYSAIEGRAQPDTKLEKLLATWRHTGEVVDLENLIFTVTPKIYEICRQTIKSNQDVDDLAQETLMGLLASPSVPRSVEAYCRTIARNALNQSLERLYNEDEDGTERRVKEIQYRSRAVRDEDVAARDAARGAEINTLLSDDGRSLYYGLSTRLIEDERERKIAELAQLGFNKAEIAVVMSLTLRSLNRLQKKFEQKRRSAVIPGLKASPDVQRKVVVLLTPAQRAFLQANQLQMAA
jgi:DNA-directed RNA polymerase specialized sigma24 family protein